MEVSPCCASCWQVIDLRSNFYGLSATLTCNLRPGRRGTQWRHVVLNLSSSGDRRKLDSVMPSLAELPELVGFFSYSREDDEAFRGGLSGLREGIQRELSAQLGRSKTTLRLWQDVAAIAPGKHWEAELKAAIDGSFFFIPIIS